MANQPEAARPARGVFDQVWLLMTLAPLFWAGNAVLGRVAVTSVPPVGLAFWRWTLGAAIVLPFAWRHLRADWRTLLANAGIVLVLSAIGVAAFNTLLYLGLRSTSALNAVMIQSSVPVLVVLMSLVFFRDRLSAMQSVGIAVSLAGTLMLVSQGQLVTLLNLEFNQGDLLVLAASICYAGYTALLRRRPSVHPLSFVLITFVLGALLLLPFYVVESLTVGPMPVSPMSVGSVVYTALCASVLAYLCFNRAVALAGANVAGMSLHLVPVFGSVLAIVLLGEEAHVYHLAGILLIACGIALASRRPAPG